MERRRASVARPGWNGGLEEELPQRLVCRRRRLREGHQDDGHREAANFTACVEQRTASYAPRGRGVILRDDVRDEDHAVVAARLDGNWLMLDNRHMVMIADQQMRHYRPVFLVDRDGVKLYSNTPSPSAASRGYERAIGQIRR
jgi:hypothetical protein